MIYKQRLGGGQYGEVIARLLQSNADIFCDSHYNNMMDIQNRLPYWKVMYPAIIVLFPCLMELNHGVVTGPNYPVR